MLKYISSFVLMIAFFSCQSKEKVAAPNIILIMADDLGYEVPEITGGKSYKTPNLDQLAKDGMYFEHCYAQPLCTPSRVKIMTGIYNVRNYIRFGILDTAQTTFAHLFKEAGYSTAIIGKWQLGKDPMSPRWAGFDEHCLWQVREGRIDSIGRDTRFSQPVLETNGELKTFETDDYGPEVVSNYGLDFIERKSKEEAPFLLYYPMILTHCPFSPTPDSPEWMKDDTTVMAYKGQAHYFEDMVAYTDKIIGRIMEKLATLGIADNTLILFTGDNGTDVPVVSQLGDRTIAGAKSKSKDAGTRVPLMVKWPKKISPNGKCKDLIDFSDVLPTICEAAAIAIPEGLDLDGRSFLPQLKGQEGNPRSWVYNWYSRNGGEEKASVFARNHDYKLYTNGNFYNIPKDYEEEKPLDIATLTITEKEIYAELKEVLDQYAERRLEDIKEL